MYDEYFEPTAEDNSTDSPPIPPIVETPIPNNSVGQSDSVTVSQEAPAISQSPRSSSLQTSTVQQGIVKNNSRDINPFATLDEAPFKKKISPEYSSDTSTSVDPNT